ncbi:response regulator [Dissulfurirhabdus thermomarina]|uniref:Response regulator n=1 Tax=Dissulfurirhabdus thermomarina TaxID=1765737 RepID=A0A6N9TL14_DISTH|nr:HD domain-containing phosphohydrolase [Dissulfurirhabdus thermomarina]NDY41809.1 response regulator [Dissulfurirhabdus thermomarina]NMX24050.1 response regulator [Dissulfurirhabdus thermomarina]
MASERARTDTTVLVVDDEPFVCDSLSRLLRTEGFTCLTAGGADEALDRLREHPEIAVVLSDIMMPGRSGIELLSDIRSRHPDVAVIMATAVDDRETAVRALSLGAYGYMIKPFDRHEVAINILNALERRRLIQESRDYEERLEAKVEQRTRDIKRREEEIALRLVSALEYRNRETGAHVQRIGRFAAAVAGALGWPAAAVEDIRLAAPMHDVGKIGIPDAILLKPGPLTPEEFAVMERHADIGARVLGGSDIPLLQMAAEIALRHHEKWDGSGYPDGLSGGDIPESARITAVCDVYDSLVHDRVYRPALTERQALDILREGRGTHFDPRVLDCFLDLLPELRRIREDLRDDAGAAIG